MQRLVSALGGLAVAGLVVFAAGCAGNEIVPLRSATGEVVPISYRVDIEARDLSGRVIPDCVVYLRNDEDPVTQVGFTDDRGRLRLSQSYRSGTMLESGSLGGADTQIRFPRFQLRAARSGYLPDEIAFAEQPFEPRLNTVASLAYVKTGIQSFGLRRVAPPTESARHPAILFASPPGGEVRLVRSTVHDARAFRMTPEPEPNLQMCVRAYLGPKGEELVLLPRPPIAAPALYTTLDEFAKNCEVVVAGANYHEPFATKDSAEAVKTLVRRLRLTNGRSFTGSNWKRHDVGQASITRVFRESQRDPRAFPEYVKRWASRKVGPESRGALPLVMEAFAYDVERPVAKLQGARADAVMRGVTAEAKPRRTVGVVVGTDLAKTLDGKLTAAGYRRLAEFWIDAWPKR
ncbi:MAG: hypothetical protein ACYS22_15975 [Planctomycetota bacterium]